MFGFKFLTRKKLEAPICLIAGDQIQLTTNLEDGTQTVHLSEPVTRAMTIDEVASITAEVEGRPAMGGLFIEKAKE